MPTGKPKFKRGDVVQLKFPGEPIDPTRWLVSAVAPDNSLDADRADICKETDTHCFKVKRGIGMLVKYLKRIKP